MGKLKKAEETPYIFKTCPFCGSKDLGIGEEIIKHEMNGANVPCSALKKTWVKCNYCGAEGPKKTGSVVYTLEDWAMAIEGWNNRIERRNA